MAEPIMLSSADAALNESPHSLGFGDAALGINGWLSPDGHFYACGFREHDRFALRLTDQVYQSPEGARRLEAECWMRVSNGTFRWLTKHRPTWAQYETACDLLNQALFPEITDRIRFSIRLMEMALREMP